MKTPGSPRRKARTNPQRHNRIEKEKYATPRQNLKRMCLAVKKKQSDEAHGNASY